MEKNTHKTKVKFLLDSDKNVFAFFPEDDYNDEFKTCYAHIGQHSACSEEYAWVCESATPEQYKALARELESIGYNLEIIKD